jgi:hypothetical protein
MMKPFLAVATAAVLFAVAPVFTGAAPVKAQGIDVQIGRDRDRDDVRRERRDRDVSVGVRPGGIVVAPRRERCRTVTTTVVRDDGRRIRKTERRCE